MAKQRSVVRIAQRFKKLTNEERLAELNQLMYGNAESPELNWRANLCTALREAGVYPKPEENVDEDSGD